MTSQQLAAAVARKRQEQQAAEARQQLAGGLAARSAGLRKPAGQLAVEPAEPLPARAARAKGRELVQHAVRTMVMRRKKRGSTQVGEGPVGAQAGLGPQASVQV